MNSEKRNFYYLKRLVLDCIHEAKNSSQVKDMKEQISHLIKEHGAEFDELSRSGQLSGNWRKMPNVYQLQEDIFRPDQLEFIEKAEQEGLKIRSYSGRGMYGDFCPGVTVDNPTDCPMKDCSWDNMGRRFIVYRR